MNPINVIDNYLDEKVFNELREALTADTFPWYKTLVVDPEKFHSEAEHNVQFAHTFYRPFHVNSNYINILTNTLQKINPSSLHRIKANLTTCTSKIVPNGYHHDKDVVENELMRIGLLYLSDSDGGTIFKTGEVIECRKNRFVEFNNSIEHSGMSHTYPYDRVVINFNFYR